jgi:hypothetical protein
MFPEMIAKKKDPRGSNYDATKRTAGGASLARSNAVNQVQLGVLQR